MKFLRRYRTRRRHILMGTQQLVLLVSFFLVTQTGADDFLYTGEDAAPVIEYIPDKKDPNRNKPSFIFGPNNGGRVVEFYSPWCPHCKKLRDQYISFARKLQTFTDDMGMDRVKVYSISCTTNNDLCLDHNITGVPRMFLLPPGATAIDPTIAANAMRLHPFIVLNRLGLHNVHGVSLPLNVRGTTTTTKERKGNTRTKRDVFNDAQLSLDYSLRNEVYKDDTNGPLTRNSKAKLRKLLELLKQVLPPNWTAKKVINAILDDFGTATSGKQNLIRILDRFPPPKNKWSKSCSKGSPENGFSCGIWNLLHIATVGVVEFNNMTDASQEKLTLPTEEVATVFRSFIGNFFGCEVCREKFMSDFASCALDRCKRLSSDHSGDPSRWQALPLWFAEYHNEVNVRLMKERADKDKRIPSRQDEIEAQWPPRKKCPKCWRSDGAFDETAAYKFLRLEYWPEDQRAVQLRKELGSNGPDTKTVEKRAPPVVRVAKKPHQTEKSEHRPLRAPGKILVTLVGVFVFLLCLRKKIRERTGHHKKVDGDEYG